ncbi:MAG TPA: HEPN domain-containing protein, partial [Gemmataceae bacterium]|nr:HEPN domain-containing protein [Gemmataceae bacterium]
MPASEAVLTVVREWIVKADRDLKAATQILKLGKDAAAETVCFHTQQCIEKYLKAVLVGRNRPSATVPRRRRPHRR